MSTVDKNHNQEEIHQDDNQSSSLGYLNQPHDQDANQSSPNQNSKKRSGPQIDRDSEVRRVYVNNRLKQKKNQNDAIYEGIFLYKPGVELPNLYHFVNQSIKIIIASEYIRKENPEVLKRNIFGTDPYTSNSDAVCMLVHSGMININTFQNKKYEGVEMTCKVIKPKKNYTGITKNNLTSRSLKGFNGNALKPESVKNLTSLGPIQILEKYASNMHIPIGKSRVRPKPKNIANIIPIPETHIVFNMNNEPAYKYSIFNIADKGFEKNQFIIKKLDTMVLYLETDNGQKYELCKKLQKEVFDVIRLSKVKHPEQVDNQYLSTHPCPLKQDQIQILYPALDWSQISWGNLSILVKKDRRIEGLKSFKFYKKDKEQK